MSLEGLSTRAKNALLNEGIKTREQLVDLIEVGDFDVCWLRKTPGIGKAVFEEVVVFAGFSLSNVSQELKSIKDIKASIALLSDNGYVVTKAIYPLVNVRGKIK